LDYLKHSELMLFPKKQFPKDAFPIYGFNERLVSQSLESETGRILSRWEDAGWGKVVADEKHAGAFGDDLVNAACDMILKRWNPNPFPEWVTCVPSLNHHELVPQFTRKVADKLGLPFKEVITKVRNNALQKLQNNSYHQCRNLDGVFSVIDKQAMQTPVLLIDDMVDSGWTLTVAGALLRRAGCTKVYPMALATTAGGG